MPLKVSLISCLTISSFVQMMLHGLTKLHKNLHALTQIIIQTVTICWDGIRASLTAATTAMVQKTYVKEARAEYGQASPRQDQSAILKGLDKWLHDHDDRLPGLPRVYVLVHQERCCQGFFEIWDKLLKLKTFFVLLIIIIILIFLLFFIFILFLIAKDFNQRYIIAISNNRKKLSLLLLLLLIVIIIIIVFIFP